MKPINKTSFSVNGLFNNEQNVIEKKNTTNFLKVIAFVAAFSLITLFSKQIQDVLISNYNKSAAFVQKHNSNVILPLGV